MPSSTRRHGAAVCITSAFALPAPFTFGTAPRNSVIGPGFANVDLVLAKTWRVVRTSQLEFRWEVFNLFNRANFGPPSLVAFSGTEGEPMLSSFGQIRSTITSARQMQLGIRISF